MPFVSLNGIAIPCAVEGGASREDLEIGEGLTRAFDGTLLRTAIGYRSQWKLNTAPDLQANVFALRRLLLGMGDHWNFNSDTYSDKGLLPGTSVGVTQSSTGGKYGGRITLSLGTGNQIGWLTQLGSDWTVVVWRFESGAYHWYLVRSDGTVYKDGSSIGGGIPAWLLGNSGGSTYLVGSAGSADSYDDLWVLPFVVPTSWVAGLYAFHQVQALPRSPTLNLTGDLASATVMGKPGSTKTVMGALSGTFYDNLEAMEFELWEV